MRKALVFLIGLLTLAVAVAACSGSKSDDNGTPTPSPSPSASPTPPFDFTVGATGWPHSDAGVRVIETNGTGTRAIVLCRTLATVSSWTVSTSALLSPTFAYNVEVWGSLSGSTTYHNGDHSWYFRRGAGSGSALNIVFPHDPTPQAKITWRDNTGCPGD